jgi:hypothetical protein
MEDDKTDADAENVNTENVDQLSTDVKLTT